MHKNIATSVGTELNYIREWRIAVQYARLNMPLAATL